jgi:hypothetical protein
MRLEVDFSWMHDGETVWFCPLYPEAARYSAEIDGDVMDRGIPGMPHHIVRLKNLDSAYQAKFFRTSLPCVPVNCVRRRT